MYVETKNLGGGLTDFPFHLIVDCPQFFPTENRSSAVVSRDGSLVRSNRALAVARHGVGRYEVLYSRDVRGCAYVAAVGDPENQLVFNPGLVFTASGHQSNSGVYVETKNLAGGLTDAPFHLYVDCSLRPLAEETLSILNVNIQGTDDTFGPFRARHARLGSWMRSSGIIPDLLVLQEAPARKCTFFNCVHKDYEVLFLLMAWIESVAGVPYRFALLSTGPPVEGGSLHQGRAILYNPARLRNVTPRGSRCQPDGGTLLACVEVQDGGCPAVTVSPGCPRLCSVHGNLRWCRRHAARLTPGR